VDSFASNGKAAKAAPVLKALTGSKSCSLAAWFIPPIWWPLWSMFWCDMLLLAALDLPCMLWSPLAAVLLQAAAMPAAPMPRP